MKYHRLETIKYNSELKSPLQNSRYTYSDRSGYIIKLYLDDYCGCGEASPLPQFSRESLKEIEWAIEELKTILSSNENYKKEELLDLFKIFTKKCPSLNFALDIALYDILAQKENISLAKYLNPKAASIVKFSSVNGNSSFATTIKVKFGIQNIDTEIKNLKSLKQKNPNAIFRIDLNRGFNINEVCKLYKKIKAYHIEYIEEPLKEPSVENFLLLKKKIINIPIAIDETVILGEYKPLIENKLIDYVILKTAIFGSIRSIFSLMDYLEKHSIKLIISSSLQTKIGNMANINIASALNNGSSHGLNNHAFFNYSYRMPYKREDLAYDLSKIVGLGASWDD